MQTTNAESKIGDYCIVLCTCPDEDIAMSLARALVENKLAACVNIVPGITSVYQWQGQIETSLERLLIIKSRNSLFEDIKSALLQRHPYELPEIISIPLNDGLANYLSWIDANVTSNQST